MRLHYLKFQIPTACVLSGVKFQNAKTREIIRQNQALDLKFSKKVFSRSKITKKVKFRTWLNEVKIYVKIKLLTSYFEKYLYQGHLRWPEVRNRSKKFNFKLYQEYTNYTSKWRSWCFFDKISNFINSMQILLKESLDESFWKFIVLRSIKVIRIKNCR